MSAFLDLLWEGGYHVSVIDQPWSPERFEDLDLMIVAGPLGVAPEHLLEKGNEHYWWSTEGRQNALDPSEVRAAVDWVRRGGSMLLILDHAPSPAAASLLTDALGVDVRNAMTWDGHRRWRP